MVLTDGSPILTISTQRSIDKPGGATRGHFVESSAVWSFNGSGGADSQRTAAQPGG
jgi:hypothetical protein